MREVNLDQMNEFPEEVREWIKTTWKNEGNYVKPVSQMNQTAFYILKKDGIDSAAKHMMEISGMDYGRMRMDFG